VAVSGTVGIDPDTGSLAGDTIQDQLTNPADFVGLNEEYARSEGKHPGQVNQVTAENVCTTMPLLKITLAAGVAALALAACGSSSSGSSASGNSGSGASSSSGSTTSSGNCEQQGKQWAKDNQKLLKQFGDSVQNFTSGSTTKAEAHKLISVAQQAQNAPLPSCADPKGYWTKAMAQVVKAGNKAGNGGIAGEAAALGPLQIALSDINKLKTELRKTANLQDF
jgi:hypothetical protein